MTLFGTDLPYLLKYEFHNYELAIIVIQTHVFNIHDKKAKIHLSSLPEGSWPITGLGMWGLNYVPQKTRDEGKDQDLGCGDEEDQWIGGRGAKII